MKEKLFVFLIVLGIILGLIHLDVIGIWTTVSGSHGLLRMNTLNGHCKLTIEAKKK